MGEVIQFPSYSDRLGRLSQRERDTKEAHQHALRARNRAIVEAVDEGHAQYRVARACNLKPASITRILALPSYDADDDAA